MIPVHIYFSDGDDIISWRNDSELEVVAYYTGMTHCGFVAKTLCFPGPTIGCCYTHKRSYLHEINWNYPKDR